MSQEISSLRSELLKAQQQLSQLLEASLAREPLLPGSLYTLRRNAANQTAVATAVSSMRAPFCPIAARDGRGTSRPHPSNSNRYAR